MKIDQYFTFYKSGTCYYAAGMNLQDEFAGGQGPPHLGTSQTPGHGCPPLPIFVHTLGESPSGVKTKLQAQ